MAKRKILTDAEKRARKKRWNDRWRKANPETYRASSLRRNRKAAAHRREYSRTWRSANRQAKAAMNKQYRASNPNYQREYRLRAKLRDAWNAWTHTLASTRARAPHPTGARL